MWILYFLTLNFITFLLINWCEQVVYAMCHTCGGQRAANLQKLVLSSYQVIARGQIQVFRFGSRQLLTELSHCSHLSLLSLIPYLILQNFQESWVLIYFIFSFFFLGEFMFLCLWKFEKKPGSHLVYVVALSLRRAIFWESIFKCPPLSLMSRPLLWEKGFSWLLGTRRMFLKCIHNCSSLIYLADLWQQPFSPAMNEYRIPKEYRMLPSIF